MKRLCLLLITVLICAFSSKAQFGADKHTWWTFSSEKTGDNEVTLFFKVKIDKGWHIYSQFTPQDSKSGLAPIPMAFEFEKNKNYTLIDKVQESKVHEAYDSTFEVKILTFEGEATFKQKVKINAEPVTIKGVVNGQVCQEQCAMFKEHFSFTIGKPTKDGTKSSENKADSSAQAIAQTPDSSKNSVETTKAAKVSQSGLEAGCGNEGDRDAASDKSLIAIFIAGMLGGFIALVTPCVFPMIPLTVSFFIKRSGSRKKGLVNAAIYAASIIVIYVSLGLLISIIFGPHALNDLASNGFFNLLFFVIFTIFAISFFGAFEITLPSWLINKADSASDRGGLIGIFFMAFTLGLVSFSCTGPIIGTLLVEAARGSSLMGPAAGMFGFSLALALPFALFAMFPGWLNSLPKSGGWLNAVKVSLGFIELALALKFLSNVDLAYHWGILKREIFIILWTIVAALWGFYLLGKLRFSHDSELQHTSISRLLFAIVAFGLALYMLPGIWGAPLKLLSGILPPEWYKEWTTGSEVQCPHDLTCFHDYDEGMRYARLQNKPVMIDFTGWNCTNCRKMEDNVWSDPKVLKRLSNDYVLISLYVDDKQDLPANEQIVSPMTGEKIKTVGDKWSDLQIRVYNKSAQPYYVLLDNREKILADPRGYTPDINKYLSFLDEGLCRYQKRKSDGKLVADIR